MSRRRGPSSRRRSGSRCCMSSRAATPPMPRAAGSWTTSSRATTCRRRTHHDRNEGAPTMSTEPETHTSQNAWPHGRGTRSSLIAQFGADRADLAGWALTTGDPLADAVVADIHNGHPQARHAVQLGIRNGLDSLVDPPDSVVALLTDTERLP